MKLKPILLLTLVLAVIIMFFVYRNMKSAGTPTMPELTNLQGEVFDTTQLKNKVYILSYFQTWCGDCIEEQPQLQQLKQHFGDDLEILLVSDEPVEKLKGFNQQYNSGLTIYHSSKSLKGELGVKAFPTTFLYGKDGQLLVKKVEGINWYNAETIDMVNASLKSIK